MVRNDLADNAIKMHIYNQGESKSSLSISRSKTGIFTPHAEQRLLPVSCNSF